MQEPYPAAGSPQGWKRRQDPVKKVRCLQESWYIRPVDLRIKKLGYFWEYCKKPPGSKTSLRSLSQDGHLKDLRGHRMSRPAPRPRYRSVPVYAGGGKCVPLDSVGSWAPPFCRHVMSAWLTKQEKHVLGKIWICLRFITTYCIIFC